MIIKADLTFINKKFHKNKYIVIKSGKIKSILDSSPTHDFETYILSPGFIDNHCHGFGGHDFMEAKPESFKVILESIAKSGTTSVFATAVTQSMELMQKMFEFTSGYKTSKKEANILGIHSEGPFISKHKKGAQPEKHIKKGCAQKLIAMHKFSKATLKIMTFAPEEDLKNEVLKKGKELGIKMQIGHCKASEEEVKKAVAFGAAGITHAYNGMPKSLENETTGFVANTNLYSEIICDGIHNSAQQIKKFIKIKGKDKIILITDAIMCAGMPDGNYLLGGQEVIKKGLNCTIKGTDTKAGSVASMLDVVKNTISMTSLRTEDVLAMATENVADYHNLDSKGRIIKDYDADLICLDKDLNLIATIIKGEVAYES